MVELEGHYSLRAFAAERNHQFESLRQQLMRLKQEVEKERPELINRKDDCIADFTAQQRELRRRAESVRSRSAPREPIRSRDETRRGMGKFMEINKYKDNHISPEFPPITGYTGHIPRIKGSEASLSQRYHCVAKKGLELIRSERDKRKELQNADKAIKTILKEDGKRYSYWNWG
ncbi:hypothetical protein EVAR_21672_1 [Eumeta japonica]|uniref:Sperm-associated microtubule inner protein 5 domain-containing protein n=1 Tax=Eumeta variegata TaxID=151549 RepID=A0A4C1VGY9_EUMVA|nr:hypothetical protein EVAR_21672_1 [Eumeta japonica]